VRYEKERGAIAKQRPGLIEERGPSQREAGSEVHRVPDESIWTRYHQPPWRVKWRGRSAPDHDEGGDTPESEDGTARTNNHSDDLCGFDARGPDDAGPQEKPRRQEQQQETNEEGRVRDRANENERGSLL